MFLYTTKPCNCLDEIFKNIFRRFLQSLYNSYFNEIEKNELYIILIYFLSNLNHTFIFETEN